MAIVAVRRSFEVAVPIDEARALLADVERAIPRLQAWIRG